ncbi:MAG TPA: ATP-binding cassette domain-containing protein [Thermoanaerobaculia bacterium]|nr:ATP-binding cassette domain-containing protein [Thermoanaerobaculia bacterium]HUM30773.1 ATP-binding cassette domain-containing protein [Thermoanaerobaculia bacterium]HXK69027.1 ATP-binding cassette domain-containing protein [Thermoanaerobaculia bacterium]
MYNLRWRYVEPTPSCYGTDEFEFDQDCPITFSFWKGPLMISVQNLTKIYGRQTLFREISFSVNAKERIGVVGRNGHGKTTLFRLILGLDEPDEGAISIPRNYRVGHLEQEIRHTHLSVLQEGCSALGAGREDEQWKVEKILAGLGFSSADLAGSPSQLSGGYAVRLNLAKVLVSEPEMLLLDEPTNYLDVLSIRWLIRFLNDWKHELMLITHDRGFMDQVVTHTLAIHRQRVRKIQGGTQKAYDQILKEEETYEKTRINDEKRRRDVEIYIQRFRAKARLAGLVQSRIKELARHEKLEKLEHLETLEFSFREAPFPAKLMGEAENLHFSYAAGGQDLLHGIGFSIRPGDRIGVMGQNGKGKSTLLKVLAGRLIPGKGQLSFHPSVLTGYYAQTNEKDLNPALSIVEELMAGGAGCTEEEARTLAGLFLFSGDAAEKKIDILSGGEKSRVLLAKLMLAPANLLLLDEPTNHLDMESCDALLAAVDAFHGAVILVTHNETFLRALASRLIVFDRGTVKHFDGTYDDFLEQTGWETDDEILQRQKASRGAGSSAAGRGRIDSKRARAILIQERSRTLNPLQEEITELESGIEALEEEQTAVNEALIEASTRGDGQAIADLSRRMGQFPDQISALYDTLADRLDQREHLTREFEKRMKEIMGDQAD